MLEHEQETGVSLPGSLLEKIGNTREEKNAWLSEALRLANKAEEGRIFQLISSEYLAIEMVKVPPFSLSAPGIFYHQFTLRQSLYERLTLLDRGKDAEDKGRGIKLWFGKAITLMFMSKAIPLFERSETGGFVPWGEMTET